MPDVETMNAFVRHVTGNQYTVWHNLREDGFFYIQRFGHEFSWHEVTVIGGMSAEGFTSLEACKADLEKFIRRTRATK